MNIAVDGIIKEIMKKRKNRNTLCLMLLHH